MPDIAMCKDEECPLNKTCYRYQADPDEDRQSYFAHSPRNVETNECKYYWECCEYCRGRDGMHKISCSTQKIAVILNN